MAKKAKKAGVQDTAMLPDEVFVQNSKHSGESTDADGHFLTTYDTQANAVGMGGEYVGVYRLVRIVHLSKKETFTEKVLLKK